MLYMKMHIQTKVEHTPRFKKVVEYRIVEDLDNLLMIDLYND